MKLTTFIVLLLAIVAVPAKTSAQAPENERQRFITEMRNYKHDFLTKELSLTRDQQRDFFPIYDEMDDELSRISSETRDIERRVEENAEATDLELENAARTVFEQKRAEGQVEMTYFEKFRPILTPRQLLKLKNAERKFTQQLMRQHRRIMRGHDKAEKAKE